MNHSFSGLLPVVILFCPLQQWYRPGFLFRILFCMNGRLNVPVSNFFNFFLGGFNYYSYLCTRLTAKRFDSLAQLVEHNTFNVGVLGSNPKRITQAQPFFLF